MALPRRSGSAPILIIAALACFGMITLVVYLASQRWPTGAPVAVAVFASALGAASILRRQRARKTWQKLLLRDVWVALIKSLPPDATAAQLVVAMDPDGSIVVADEQGHRLEPSAELLQRVRKLEAESKRRKDRWERLFIRVQKEGKDWQSNADFDYGPSAGMAEPSPAA